MRRRRHIGFAAAAVALVLAAVPVAAQADWSGDGKADVLAVHPDGRLLLYRTNGAGAFSSAAQPVGAGWAQFTAVLSPGDWSGDGKPDLLTRKSNGDLLLYRGDGDGGFVTGAGQRIGTGWAHFTALLAPGDWSGDGHPDVLARKSNGDLLLYRGDGTGGFADEPRPRIGSGWGQFTALLTPGDWDGDGHPDLIARPSDGRLLLYRGTGAGGFVSEDRRVIGTGWGQFTALVAGGDFSGDQAPDVLARTSDGKLLLYRSSGTGSFISEARPTVGTGWGSLDFLTLLGTAPPAPPPAPVTPPPTTSAPAPLPNGSAGLTAGLGCLPPGRRLRVKLTVRHKSGASRPRVRKVVFYARGGGRRTDRKAPYVVRLRVKKAAGAKGRVYARVSYKRKGAKRLRHKTVWRRYTVCA